MPISTMQMTTSIHQVFEAQVQQQPDAIAIEFEGECLTYQSLNEKANQLAHCLQLLGVKPDTLVGICVERSLDMVMALLAILKAGGAYVPLDPNYPSERLAAILDDANPPLLITQTSVAECLPEHQSLLVYIDRKDLAAHCPISEPNNRVQPHHLAYVIYTSGSTGRPKGVAIEHRNTLALIRWAKRFFSPQQLAGVLASTSLCFDLSIFELFVTLASGGTIILAENALQLPRLKPKTPITLVNTVPSAIKALWQQNGIPTSVRTINLAGEPLQNALVQHLYELKHVEQVFNLYGPSEDTTYSTAALIPKGATGVPSIGRPIVGTQIYLLDSNLQPVSVGREGEIYISGDGVARGYLNRPELTAERFISNPFSTDPNSRLYKAGDLAIYNNDGSLKFLGRIDHQVKIRGFRIELGEIEATLNQHPAISESVVVARDDALGHKRLIAYTVPKTLEAGASNSTPDNANDHLSHWQQVWNATYHQPSEASGESLTPEDPSPVFDDPTFNIQGWTNSLTGQLMSRAEMQEWVDHTVQRIIDLQPQRVLEIGCGSGLLLFRIAPSCQQYVGLDLSSECIQRLQRALDQQQQARNECWSHVHLMPKAAHDLDEFEAEAFDTIIINSVVQYFPSMEYLVQVLKNAVKLVKPGGKIFIGDVRNLPLLQSFHTNIQLYQASDGLSCQLLKQKVQEQIAADNELVIHPDFFTVLSHHIPQISNVQTQLKRGHSSNELSRFRFDVVLHIDTPVQERYQPMILDWQDQSPSVNAVGRLVRAITPSSLRITNISDARTIGTVKATEILNQCHIPDTVGQLRQQVSLQSNHAGIHPEEFWVLAQTLPYDISVTPTGVKTPGTYDVVFKRQSPQGNNGRAHNGLTVVAPPLLELKDWEGYGNHPSQTDGADHLIPALRAYVAEQLPDYMVPKAIVMMERFPLTLNGKVDRKLLPEPQLGRPTLSQDYVAPSTELERAIATIWSQLLGIDPIGIHDNFFELGGHSLLAVQLLSQIETELQIELPLFYLLRQATVKGMVEAIATLQPSSLPSSLSLSSPSGCSSTASSTTPLTIAKTLFPNDEEASTAQSKSNITIDWHAECTLDPAIKPYVPYRPSVTSPQHILLTGVTGFLGAFLLDELLQQTSATIYCLVRASDPDRAWLRLRQNLEHYRLWTPSHHSRIVPILGDLSAPLLGLSEGQFETLAQQLDSIYHCGASVNLVYPYDALRQANVGGTIEILKLACHRATIPVHFISTLDVFQSHPNLGQTPIQSHEFLGPVAELDNGYAQTKWVAEALLKTAQSRGVPVSIYRPGMVTGHSRTGVSQTNDLLCRIIKGMIQLEAAPNLDQWVNMVPVDYASRAIIYLSQNVQHSQTAQPLNSAFHITNPHSLPWPELLQAIQALGYPLQVQAHADWQDSLKHNGGQDNVLNPMRSLFTQPVKGSMTYLEEFLLMAQAFSCENTLKGLEGASISCPVIDRNLLATYFSYFCQSHFLTSGPVESRLDEFIESEETAYAPRQRSLERMTQSA